MITDLEVQNLRSFTSQSFRIAPLTILLGQNSSGKSSITRLFPLFKQSMEQVASAPVLWNSTYVDYGSFQEVLSRQAKTPEMTFTFQISTTNFSQHLLLHREYGAANQYAPKSFSFKIVLGGAPKGRTKTIKSVIHMDDDCIEIIYDKRRRVTNVTINGDEPSTIWPGASADGIQHGFAPVIRISDFPGLYLSTECRALGAEIMEELKYCLPSNLNVRVPYAIGRNLHYMSSIGFKSNLIDVIAAHTGHRISPNRMRNASVEKIKKLLLLRDLPRIARMVQDNLTGDFVASQYIGPIRARAERYYRIQELAIDHIDPNGENVAMYLHFLSPAQLKRFNAVFLDAFGYTVEPSQSRGHVSLILREGGVGKGDNIADVGFGFSQVLPVVAQIFAATARRVQTSTGSSRAQLRSPVVAVEQPELHLHPAYQARLADLFTQLSVKNNPTGRTYRFVIETHSEAFVNRLGRLVYEKTLRPEDVVLYAFEKDHAGGTTHVKELRFGLDGLINGWPIGFLSAR